MYVPASSATITTPCIIFAQNPSQDFIIIIIMMFLKGQACCLFHNPQDELGPSISSSAILCSFVLLADTIMLV
jgi:hypothetical protein